MGQLLALLTEATSVAPAQLLPNPFHISQLQYVKYIAVYIYRLQYTALQKGKILSTPIQCQIQFLFPGTEDHWVSLWCAKELFYNILHHVSLLFFTKLSHRQWAWAVETEFICLRFRTALPLEIYKAFSKFIATLLQC